MVACTEDALGEAYGTDSMAKVEVGRVAVLGEMGTELVVATAVGAGEELENWMVLYQTKFADAGTGDAAKVRPHWGWLSIYACELVIVNRSVTG